MKLKEKFKKIKSIPLAFPSYKVTLKSLNMDSPSYALNYLVGKYEGVTITVTKQRTSSITIEIHCIDTIYQQIKLNFVKDMGRNFLWKD